MEPPFKHPFGFFDGIQWAVHFSKEDWEKTLQAVRAYIPSLHQRIDEQDHTIQRTTRAVFGKL